MSTYYPIEFLPEKTDLGNPATRNFFRNNLPFEEAKGNNNPEDVTATFGKVQSFLTSSINNENLLNTHETIVNKKDKNNTETSTSAKTRITRVNIDSRLRNIQPKHILDTKLNNLQNALFFTENKISSILLFKLFKILK